MPTWDEVRARSEEKIGRLTVFCWDCDLAFQAFALPCRKHATADETVALDARISEALAGAPLSSLLGDHGKKHALDRWADDGGRMFEPAATPASSSTSPTPTPSRSTPRRRASSSTRARSSRASC